MEKFLQAVVLVCGLFGSMLAFMLLGSERVQQHATEGDSLDISHQNQR